jgi:C4-dicarboxylate-specific signal transduction histidine kinase
MPKGMGGAGGVRASTSVVILGVLVVLFIIATFSAMAWQRRDDLLHDGRNNNERLADTLAEHANGLFRNSALVLAMVGERLERESRTSSHQEHDPAFQAFLASLLHQAPMVAAVRVIAPDGAYLHSYPERPPEGIVVADRDYVQVHLNAGSGLFLGKPIISRVSGKLVLPVSRAHRDAQGRLQAVLAVMIHLDEVNALFESVRQKPNGTIALFGTDGTMLGRGPMDDKLIGKNFAQGPLFKDHLAKAPSGSYTSVVVTDGKLRQASYRQLSGIPAVVSVSTLYDDTMSEWHEYITALAAIAVPLLLAAAAITWALYRQLVQRERFERLLARRTSDLELANEELRYMAEISAHHLQEPLRTVLSYAQLLVRKASDGGVEGLEEYLAFVRSGVERMKSQLDALQRYLGVAQCRPLEQVNLSRVLAETIDLLEPRLQAAGASIEAEDLPTIMGDRQHMSGLFHHMLSAILDRRRPNTHQTIRIWPMQEDGIWHLTVSADNTDIDFGESETSFPVLGAGSTPEKGGGAILNLAMSRKIVQMHGGRMWAETIGDGETRLHVSLPAE